MRGPGDVSRVAAAAAGCVGALATAATLSGCAGVGGASEPWDEPDDYTYEATITVFGPAAGEWRVTVQDGAVAAVEPLDEDAEYSEDAHAATADDFQTFAEYEEWHARLDGAAVNSLTRDADGALRRFELDGSESTSDDEFLIVVSEVTVP